MRAWHWFVAAVAVAIGAVAFALGRRSVRPDMQGELGVIDLKAKVRERLLDQDAESARAWVENKYAETIKQLDEDALERADDLRDNPVGLAVFFDRTARKLRAEQG